ncbi:MAG TPA: glycosyltransferase family A protein [Myxococcales bacterium]
MAVLCSLRRIESREGLARVELPARGGLGAFAIRSQRGGLAFARTKLSVGGPAPLPEPTLLTEEAAGIAVLEREAPDTRKRRARAKPASRAPAVSVVVPFFNLARYLPETLASIRRQTFESYEIVVVDDGSTDSDCADLLRRLEGEGVRVVRKPNGGLASARNAGFREARGRFVLPLDADDLIAPDYLETAVRALSLDSGLSYVTTLVADFETSPEKPTGGWCPWGADMDLLPVMNCAGACTALFVRDDVLAVGGYDETLTSFEDWDLYATLAGKGFEGLVLPQFLFFYRSRPGSMLRTEGVDRRGELRSRLVQKHLASAPHPERAARLLISELEDSHALLRMAEHKSVARLLERSRVGNRVLAAWRGLPVSLRQRLLGAGSG